MVLNSLLKYEEPRYFSVSEISTRIKNLLEDNLGYVKIKGEISGFTRAASGHGYFSLKDERAVISATCWRFNLVKVNFELEEGLEVVVSGKVTAFAGQSKYQISVEKIEPAGAGAFMQILKERKAKLEKEGLFDTDRKKPLPFFPKTIGIVTSPTGAVIRDIIHRISDRCPARLLVWPVTVQGDTAAKEVSAAIDGFNKLFGADRPDLIIVARGGGSIEDLWSFNEEIVVRSACNSSIPLISAVGHETDYTLIDLAADKRAPTPTAAAEFAVPVASDLRYTINAQVNSIAAKLSQRLSYHSKLVASYDRILHYPANYFNSYIQRVDDFGIRLGHAMPKLLRYKHQSLTYFPTNRFIPNKLLILKKMSLVAKSDFLERSKSSLVDIYTHKFEVSSRLHESLDYRKVLKRGYVMARDSSGKYISKTAGIEKKSKLQLVMHDGQLDVEVS